MKRRNIKLIMTISILLLCLFTVANIASSYIKIRNTVEESIVNQSLIVGESIAKSINLPVYKRFLQKREKDEDYWEVREYLNDARKKTGLLYIYTVEVDNPQIAKSLIVGQPKWLDNSEDYPIGRNSLIPEHFVRKAYKDGQPFVTNIIKDSRYGTYITVGTPLKDQDGTVISYLGIDLDANTLDGIKKVVIENNMLLFIFNGLLIIIAISAFILLQRWYQKTLTAEVVETEDTYQAEIKSLITAMSSVRHDFTNHIQVLYGLLQLGANEQAQQYVETLSKEVQGLPSMQVNVYHPGLSILLQTKKFAAQSRQIQLDFTVSNCTFEFIKTTDLIKILSNLIDNAIDATCLLPEEERKIIVTCQNYHDKYVFQVKNTGHPLKGNEPLFEQGYTTKSSNNRAVNGQGLFIVKSIVEKYNGHITLYSRDDRETIAYVEIPL